MSRSGPVSYTHLDVYKRQVEDVVNIGDMVTVKVLDVDKMGKISLSMKPGDLAKKESEN